MQDFLAGGGKRQGDYTELQVGPAPTQMQNFPVPKKSVTEWTEWFKGFDADISVVRGADYKAALDSIETWMKTPEGFSQEVVQDWDEFFRRHATDSPTEILVSGQPWGALEELRLGHPLAPGLKFELPPEGTHLYFEAQPWVELVKQGTFSKDTLSRIPTSYQTTDAWYDLIKKSAEKELTWLHAMFLGINSTERGDIEEPKRYFRTSMEMKPNPVSARCLAVLSKSYDEAWPFYETAWSTLHTQFASDPAYERLSANLVTEISFFLQQSGWCVPTDSLLTPY